MAIATTGLKNTLCDAYKGAGTWLSLHTASPGSTGANEATGGSPAYARKQTTWGSSSGGAVTGSSVTFDVAAGTYTHWGLWTASTAGTFLDGGALSSSQAPGAQSQIIAPITFTQT